MQQEQALAIMKTGRNVFLTGSAGAGKTYVLNQYIQYLREHSIGIGITASTGIAATHIGGMTIHAWSGIGIRDRASAQDIEEIAMRQNVRKHVRGASVLIIDEVSMLAAHVIDMVDRVCRVVRESEESFGGLQVIFCGDFFQLPPIAGRRTEPGEDVSYDDPFFAAESDAWRDADVQVCYLDTQYRHEDDALTEILNALRSGEVTEELQGLLRRRINAPLALDVVPTRLYTHNIDVDRINDEHLQALDTEGRRYVMTYDGNERIAGALRRSCLAPEELIVRSGAAVMFVKNNFEEGYANGTLGTVVGFTPQGFPRVQITSGEVIVAQPATWEVDGEDGAPRASIKQIPLRLAWAMTVHKSQGMTLDAAVIDLSKSFVSGMGYVALSRVRSLKTLSLVGFNATALVIEDRIRELDGILRARAEDAESWIALCAQEEIARMHADFLARAATKGRKSTQEVTHQMCVRGMTIAQVAAERGLSTETIIGHVEKLLAGDAEIDVESIVGEIDEDSVREIQSALKASVALKLAPAYRRCKGRYTYEQLRLVRLLLIGKQEV